MAITDIAKKLSLTLLPSTTAPALRQIGTALEKGVSAGLEPFVKQNVKDRLAGEYAFNPERINLVEQVGKEEWVNLTNDYKKLRTEIIINKDPKESFGLLQQLNSLRQNMNKVIPKRSALIRIRDQAERKVITEAKLTQLTTPKPDKPIDRLKWEARHDKLIKRVTTMPQIKKVTDEYITDLETKLNTHFEDVVSNVTDVGVQGPAKGYINEIVKGLGRIKSTKVINRLTSIKMNQERQIRDIFKQVRQGKISPVEGQAQVYSQLIDLANFALKPEDAISNILAEEIFNNAVTFTGLRPLELFKNSATYYRLKDDVSDYVEPYLAGQKDLGLHKNANTIFNKIIDTVQKSSGGKYKLKDWLLDIKSDEFLKHIQNKMLDKNSIGALAPKTQEQIDNPTPKQQKYIDLFVKVFNTNFSIGAANDIYKLAVGEHLKKIEAETPNFFQSIGDFRSKVGTFLKEKIGTPQ